MCTSHPPQTMCHTQSKCNSKSQSQREQTKKGKSNGHEDSVQNKWVDRSETERDRIEVEREKKIGCWCCLLRLHIILSTSISISFSSCFHCSFDTKAPHIFFSFGLSLLLSLSRSVDFFLVSVPIHRFVIFKQGSHFEIQYVYLSSSSWSNIQLCTLNAKRSY